MPRDGDEVGGGPTNSALRTLHFWRRAGAVYAAYKAAQVKAFALRARGWDAARLTAEHWQPHHAWAGNEFYSMAVDLRGFYLKVNTTQWRTAPPHRTMRLTAFAQVFVPDSS